MKQLLIATTNKGKILELTELLAELKNVKLVTPDKLGLNLNVVEDGNTYAENAALKSNAFAKASGLISLADDSGLEVSALNGAPGLYSARYSPLPNATDADRRAYLLENLNGKSRPWLARFHATVAVSIPDGETYFGEGECAGEIIQTERGTGGFGYDPIFLMDEVPAKTMAELSMDEKNRLSHRARAVQSAMPILLKLFS